MTVPQEDHTPDDLRSIVDEIFNNLDALRSLNKNQRIAHEEMVTLDQKIQCLEDDVARSVMNVIDLITSKILTHHLNCFRLKEKQSHLEIMAARLQFDH